MNLYQKQPDYFAIVHKPLFTIKTFQSSTQSKLQKLGNGEVCPKERTVQCRQAAYHMHTAKAVNFRLPATHSTTEIWTHSH